MVVMAWDLIAVFLFLGLVQGSLAQVDPCKSYAEVNEPFRSIGHKPQPTDKLLCDRSMRDAWYRFTSKAGGMMPISCIDQFTCGTHAPIWLDGIHPTFDEGEVQRKACVHVPSWNPLDKNTCCGMTWPVGVKACKDAKDNAFYVYRLERTPGCSMAYCAGTEKPCSADEFSSTGFTPCKAAFPKMTGPPTMSGPDIEYQDGKPVTFNFNCHISVDAKDTSGTYEVVWLFNHVESSKVPKMYAKGADRTVPLAQKFLAGHMGKVVSCKVRSTFEGSGRFSDWKESNSYWVGMEVNPTRLEVGEKEETKEVSFSSTIPIVCEHRMAFFCQVDVEMDIDSSDAADVVAAEACIRSIKTEDWDAKTKRAATKFQVVATRDFKTDGDKTMAVKFKPVFSFSPAIWNDYTPSKLTLITKDQGTQRCQGTGDPHFSGFDRKAAYHLYNVGEYVMHKSKARPFELQIRTWTCWKVSCICAIAVREGNDVITIDMCNGRWGKTSPKLKVRSQNQLLEGTSIKRDPSGRWFQIFFPSGGWVKAQSNTWGLNVYTQAPSDDFAKTEGICGTFDNNAANDYTMKGGQVYNNQKDVFPKQFFESWRVPYGTSFFDKVPAAQSKYEYNPRYCKCQTGTGKVDCRVENKVDDPVKRGVARWKDVTKTVNKKLRVRRDTTYHDLDTDEDASYTFHYGSKDDVVVVPTFPTPSGRTEQQAKDYCKNAIYKSSLVKRCDKSKINIDAILGDCVEDLKISDDVEFAKTGLSKLEDACQELILKDPANYVKGDNGTSVPPAFVTEDLCPNDCNLMGTCKKGVCACNTGLTGSDCSISLTSPPDVFEITRGGLCDIRKRPCVTAYLEADNLMDSPTLTCRVRNVEVVDGRPFASVHPTSAFKLAPAEFESFREVGCVLPPPKAGRGKAASGLMISVSNDGRLWSKESLFLTYDGLCQTCKDGECMQKNNTCLIDGRCYNLGDTAVGNQYKVCDPVKDTKEWTEVPTTLAPTTTTTTLAPTTTTTTQAPITNPPWWAPLGGKAIDRWDIWTKSKTGCVCYFDTSRTDCACCDDGGCQCDQTNKEQCVKCGETHKCGSPQPTGDNGIDGWTFLFSGCPCAHDPTGADFSCACCQNLGCNCDNAHKNQCVQCGRPDLCGKKPEIYGPPMN